MYKKREAGKGGRLPFDAVLMFKVTALQHFYNLSDDQTEFQIRDRHSFCRFLGLSPEGRVPDAKTIWLFRERLRKGGLVDGLFQELLSQIDAAGADGGRRLGGGAEAAQQPRGERGGEVGRDAGGVERGEAAAEGCGRSLDEEARRGALRMQEPRSVDRKHKVIRRSWTPRFR